MYRCIDVKTTFKVDVRSDENEPTTQYDDESARVIAEEALAIGGKFAFVSTPSSFKALLGLVENNNNNSNNELYLFEYDKRFRIYGDKFVFYDYKQPKNVPMSLRGSCDFVTFDPPFLSEECLEKYVTTVKLLGKRHIESV